MKHIVAYTLKHNDIPDTFKDEYMIFDDNEMFNALELAESYYNDWVLKKEIEDWHVFHASISTVIKSTDF